MDAAKNLIVDLEALGLRAAMALPEWVQRRLVGKPVVRDGAPLAVDTQLLLLMQKVLREPAVETLPIVDGRASLKRTTRLIGGRQPIGSVRRLTVGHHDARLYYPTSLADDDALLVFFHGGGFIYLGLEEYDATCRFLAERSGIKVLSVDYTLSPEVRFPTSILETSAAYRWVVENAHLVGAKPEKIAVGGDSAGGNLAANAAVHAARDGIPCAYQLLVYPVTEVDHLTESYDLFAEGFFLTRGFIELATENYVAAGTDAADPRLSLSRMEVPANLAPAYIATAGFDPLRDEGEAYAEQLAAAGVDVRVRRFEDQIHGFFNTVGVGRSAVMANAEIAAELRRALAGRPPHAEKSLFSVERSVFSVERSVCGENRPLGGKNRLLG